MSLREKLIILCAPLTFIIEWSVFVYVATQFPLDFDKPLSALPYYHPSFAITFGLLLTTVAITFGIFTLALRPYWKDAFRFAVVCGLLAIIAGWTHYNPEGSFGTTVHDMTANLATLGYSFILFQVGFRAQGILRRACMVFTGIAMINIAAVIFSVHVLHSYVTWFQLSLTLTVQFWALYTAYYLWTKPHPATQQSQDAL